MWHALRSFLRAFSRQLFGRTGQRIDAAVDDRQLHDSIDEEKEVMRQRLHDAAQRLHILEWQTAVAARRRREQRTPEGHT